MWNPEFLFCIKFYILFFFFSISSAGQKPVQSWKADPAAAPRAQQVLGVPSTAALSPVAGAENTPEPCQADKREGTNFQKSSHLPEDACQDRHLSVLTKWCL